MKFLHVKLELIPLVMGAWAGIMSHELFEKVIMTSIAMVVGTTISFFWRLYLIKKRKDRRNKKDESI